MPNYGDRKIYEMAYVKISFSLYDTSLKLAMLIYYVILRDISRRFFFKKFNVFWVIAAKIVPNSGDRKICEVAC